MPHIKKSLFFPEKPSGNELPYLASVEQLRNANQVALFSALFGSFQGINPLLMFLVIRTVFRLAVYLYWKNDPDWQAFSRHEAEKERIRLREGVTARKTWLELAYFRVASETNIEIKVRGERVFHTAKPELYIHIGLYNGLELEEHVFPASNIRLHSKKIESGQIRFPSAYYTNDGDLAGISGATVEVPAFHQDELEDETGEKGEELQE